MCSVQIFRFKEDLVLFHTGTGKGLFGGDDRVVYWKCEAGTELQEYLTVPLNNGARERALLLASQQVRVLHL